MAVERRDYPAILPQVSPPQAADILHDRVRQVGRLNIAIADWLQERRRLEEQYSAGLRRLAQRPLNSAADLGVFSVPWTTLTGSADTVADSHSTLASKIEVDVERPLREFERSNREMTQVTTMQGNLAAIAKEVEKAQAKLEKLPSREGSKFTSATAELDGAQSHWESQAPYVFESLQALDEARLNHLRDVLTQFQTHEVDLVEKNRVSAEQCLNILLNVETADEIKTFALKAVQQKPTLGRKDRDHSSFSTPSRGASGAGAAAIGTAGAVGAAGASALTPSSTRQEEERERQGSIPEDKQKGRLKGLKRLGTVIGRRRESKIPEGLPPPSESPERRPRFSRRGKSKDTPSLEPTPETPASRDRPRSPLRLGSELFNSASSTGGPTSPLPSTRNLDTAAQTNGLSGSLDRTPQLPSIPNGSHQGDLADLEPPKPSQSIPPEPQKDSEGFSVPPPNLDPITQAQQEAGLAGEGSAAPFNVNIRDAPIQEEGSNREAALASVATTLSPPPTRRGGTVRGRRDNRNSMITGNTYPPPIETPSEARSPSAPAPLKLIAEPASPETSAPIVQPPPQTSSVSPTAAAATGVAAAGTVAGAAIAASSFSPFSSQTENSLPFRTDSRSPTAFDPARADTQSIRSTMTSASQGGVKHPDLNEAGLSSSIVETLSARFENGKLTSSSLIGEVALANNISTPPSSTSSTLRLSKFANLDKIAVNPAFISQTSATNGEYTINLASLGKTQVAFKYQARTDDVRTPLLITLAVRTEPSQLSVIANYSLHPDISLPTGQDHLTLSNVVLAISVDGAKATSCQSKPVGVFSKERNIIYWQLHEARLTPGASPEKLLARFVTESEAKGAAAEARWEIIGDAVTGLGSGLNISIADGNKEGTSGGGDPFADEDGHVAAASTVAEGWRPVQGPRKLVSGNYGAK